MIIENVRVYGLDESIGCLKYSFNPNAELDEPTSKEWDTAKKCGHANIGSGHDCVLKGIIVQFDVTAPHYWWPQFQRYHFADIVMSTSKMHSLLKMDLDELCVSEVTQKTLNHIKELLHIYNTDSEENKKINWRILLANCPLGLMLKARITTNYLQLKTMYAQRSHHKLSEWREEFCPWVESLPKFKELILENE